MKPNIHPDYHDIKVTRTDGTQFTTKSTWGTAGATMSLEVDPLTHPAWTGGVRQLVKDEQLARFNRRFESFNLGGGQAAAPAAAKTSPAAAPAKPAEAKEAKEAKPATAKKPKK